MTTLKNIKKVSVIVPNYNYAEYLKRRILSIVRQTYPIYEMIILDDASKDDSKVMIKKMVAEAKRINPDLKIKMIWNEKNSGKVISQWIKGVEAASGDYVWIAEADDISRKDFLAEMMKGFEKDGDVRLAYSESAIINKYGIVILPNFRRSRDKEKTGHFNNSYIKQGKKEIEEILAIRCTIPNVSAVVFQNTPEFLKCLKLAEKFRQVGDWYLYVKILENGKIFYNHRVLNLFRVHKKSATLRSNEHIEEIEKMHEYFRKNYELDQTILEWMDAEVARAKRKYGIIE